MFVVFVDWVAFQGREGGVKGRGREGGVGAHFLIFFTFPFLTKKMHTHNTQIKPIPT